MHSEKTDNVLQTEDLSIGYLSKRKTTTIAQDIQLKLKSGTLIGLVGANGIGKSTLLRSLCGMQKHLGGTITIKSKEIHTYHPVELATLLSVVLTEAPASRNLSTTEFVSLGRQPHTNWMGKLSEMDRSKVEKAIEQTQIADFREKHCFELSDGQMQRVAIARALAQDTEIILLDEPTTHLDLYHRAAILKLLKKLSITTGKTILFSTHEIDLAIQLADEMIVMTKNKTITGSPRELIRQGHFDALFPKDTISFDADSGRFTIQN